MTTLIESAHPCIDISACWIGLYFAKYFAHKARLHAGVTRLIHHGQSRKARISYQ
jgi:hypothetical protein